MSFSAVSKNVGYHPVGMLIVPLKHLTFTGISCFLYAIK